MQNFLLKYLAYTVVLKGWCPAQQPLPHFKLNAKLWGRAQQFALISPAGDSDVH